MDVFLVVLQSVLALLGIGVIGFWITRRGIIPENILSILSRLAIDIALPCLVFAGIIANFSPKDLPDWWQLPLWFFVFTGTSLALSLLFMFLSPKETRSEFVINLFYQNGLFFPLIIISGIFGANSPYLPILYLFIMLHPVMFFSTYQLFFRNRKKETNVRWNRILNPVLIATVVAVGLQLLGLHDKLPDFLKEIFQILGGMALPLVMIILGGSLYLDFKQRGKIYLKEIIKFVALKNFVWPLLFLGGLMLIKPAYGLALIFFLQAAVPPVTSTPILTERVGGNKSIATQFVFSSFIFSVISIPLTFWLFNHYFPMPGK
jgi:predicted permease